jgi:hypothetical protein
VKVRTASFDDYPQITELESKYGMQTKTREEWEHLWVNNPVYQQLNKTWPIGWVLEDSAGKILGYLGNIPIFYELHGKRLLVATSRAWVVDSTCRSYSPLLLDYFFAQTNVDLYLTTNLSNEAFETFQFFEPSAVPVGDWDHSRFWITSYTSFVASCLRAMDIPLAKPLSYPLALLPLLRDQLGSVTTGLKKERKYVEVQFCSAFDERFDIFWEDLKAKRANVLMSTRTGEMLNWHFGHALLRNKAWMICVSERSRLLAYSIFYRQDNTRFGLKRVRLLDFQTLANDQLLLLPILSCALEYCRGAGIHMLESLGVSPDRAQVMARLRPYRRNLRSWPAFYKTNNPHLRESLKNPKCWVDFALL